VVVPITATFSNDGVDEKDVIIMTQMRQINDLEKSLKVAEKRLQLVIGSSYCIIRTVIVCNLLKSNLFCTIVK